MAESWDHRSSSQEPPPKFPRCLHFHRHGDNHDKCQQCCFNDGLHECTRKTPCQVCQVWIPENWNAHEKALKQKLKRKRASAAKKMQESAIDDSIELHAQEDSLCGSTEKSQPGQLSRNPSPAKVQPRADIPAMFSRKLSCLPSPMVPPGLRGRIASTPIKRWTQASGLSPQFQMAWIPEAPVRPPPFAPTPWQQREVTPSVNYGSDQLQVRVPALCWFYGSSGISTAVTGQAQWAGFNGPSGNCCVPVLCWSYGSSGSAQQSQDRHGERGSTPPVSGTGLPRLCPRPVLSLPAATTEVSRRNVP